MSEPDQHLKALDVICGLHAELATTRAELDDFRSGKRHVISLAHPRPHVGFFGGADMLKEAIREAVGPPMSMEVGETLDTPMISMPVAEWEKHQAEVAGLRNSLGLRKLMHDEHKAELTELKRECATREATMREIRSDLGGLYANLKLPSAVREMLSTSRGIRDPRIADLELANALRADRLAAVRQVLDDNATTRADDEAGMRAMYAALRRALSSEAS